ncbi:unnamed protein product, partial [Tuber aestivum]
AAANGKESVVRLLLERGAEVDAEGGYYSNALQAAAQNGNESILQLLLSYGAVPNAE